MLYRRFNPEYASLSPINKARIDTGMQRPQLHEAVQWWPGADTQGLNARNIELLEPGDYIVLDKPEFPYVEKKAWFEENTELIG